MITGIIAILWNNIFTSPKFKCFVARLKKIVDFFVSYRVLLYLVNHFDLQMYCCLKSLRQHNSKFLKKGL